MIVWLQCACVPVDLCINVCRCLDKAAIVAANIGSPSSPWKQAQDASFSAVSCSSKSKMLKSGMSSSNTRKLLGLVSVSEVEEAKAFLGIMPLFLCICM